MYSGTWVDNETIIGWYMCNGDNGTVNLVDKFVRGGITSGASGGSDDAVVVVHNHNATQPPHSHIITLYQDSRNDGTRVEGTDSLVSVSPLSTYERQPSITVYNKGVSGVDKNIPAYYTLIFIQRIN